MMRQAASLIVAIVRISAERRLEAGGWAPAIGETLREARLLIEQAAKSRREFEEWGGRGRWKNF